MSIKIGSKVRFIDKDGEGDDASLNGDIGFVIGSDGHFGRYDNIISVRVEERNLTLTCYEHRWELVEEIKQEIKQEVSIDEVVKQCKNIKAEIQQLKQKLSEQESVLLAAGVKLI
jgi:hypothetical protein